MSIFGANLETVLCQYQDKIKRIPKETLAQIPHLFSPLPNQYISFLAGIQIYQTKAVRFMFDTPHNSFLSSYQKAFVSTRIPIETVDKLISLILEEN